MAGSAMQCHARFCAAQFTYRHQAVAHLTGEEDDEEPEDDEEADGPKSRHDDDDHLHQDVEGEQALGGKDTGGDG